MSDTSDSTYEAASVEVPAVEPAFDTSAYDATTTVTDMGTTTTDTTDWSTQAAISAEHTADYYAQATAGSDLWNASVDAYVAGDDQLAYDLNQASLAAYSSANESWDDAADAWQTQELTAVTEYEVTTTYEPVDTSYTSSYTDTSYTETSTYEVTSTYDAGTDTV